MSARGHAAPAPAGSPCAWSYPPDADAVARAVLDATRRGELRRRCILRLRTARARLDPGPLPLGDDPDRVERA